MLMKADVARELQLIADALVAANPSVVNTQAVKNLFKVTDEIPELKTRLLGRLNSLLGAIQSGRPAALASVAGLRQHVMKAIQELESPGEGAGVGDKIRH